MNHEGVKYKMFIDGGFSYPKHHAHLYMNIDEKNVLCGGMVQISPDNKNETSTLTIDYENKKISDEKYFIALFDLLSSKMYYIDRNIPEKSPLESIKISIDEENYGLLELLKKNFPKAIKNLSFDTDTFDLDLKALDYKKFHNKALEFQNEIDKKSSNKIEFTDAATRPLLVDRSLTH